MLKESLITTIENYLHELFDHDPTGHDYYHMKRVAHWSKVLAEKEGADPFICEIAGWLHDVGDAKLFQDPAQASEQALRLLSKQGILEQDCQQIKMAMADVSFSKGRTPQTLEGKIVQDADRLDAIGAIGIARTFAFGGAHSQLIHHDEQGSSTSIQHFYDKLLKLSDLIHTKSAKEEAQIRHQYMVDYLQRFLYEWEVVNEQ
ncbi:HD domain-containing protein [Halobacillus naozhouensis]|uniref:HD domain-containing protein n=1 Tax=Halobacillus naozhouensis TaxID=554880 RepID=A0ABY8IW86_9BACI|nr:HD domain-containing protein [Halobacillus naozhouensis]WFT73046.1 HD domain-containing protein [Halobacillus naozhouensis]